MKGEPMRPRLLLTGFLLMLVTGLPDLAAIPPQPGAQDRCAVCGMFVAHYHDWVATIEFRDGSRFYFDGPKDLFICFFDLPTYRKGASTADVTAVYVTEYYSTDLVDAREVFFVTDSDVLGPMGQELVPVRGREAAETFRRDHGGKRLLTFNGNDLVEVAPLP
jgi:nitrous oxide reductase accessory protein NosL